MQEELMQGIGGGIGGAVGGGIGGGCFGEIVFGGSGVGIVAGEGVCLEEALPPLLQLQEEVWSQDKGCGSKNFMTHLPILWLPQYDQVQFTQSIPRPLECMVE